MIIGLTGYAQSGKDTVANILVNNYGYTRVAFADKIREFVYRTNPLIETGISVQDMVDEYGWDVAKQNSEVRRLLQNFGVTARDMFGDTFWINQLLWGYDWSVPTVVTDVRFENEAKYLKKWTPDDTQLWRIKRPGVEAVNSHVSESQLDGYPVDQIFMNNGTLEDLEVLIKTRMNGLL